MIDIQPIYNLSLQGHEVMKPNNKQLIIFQYSLLGKSSFLIKLKHELVLFEQLHSYFIKESYLFNIYSKSLKVFEIHVN